MLYFKKKLKFGLKVFINKVSDITLASWECVQLSWDLNMGKDRSAQTCHLREPSATFLTMPSIVMNSHFLFNLQIKTFNLRDLILKVCRCEMLNSLSVSLCSSLSWKHLWWGHSEAQPGCSDCERAGVMQWDTGTGSLTPTCSLQSHQSTR